jgi:hypothetical protein
MSRSHLYVRLVLVAASLGLVVLTLLSSPGPVPVAGVVLAALTAYAATRPDSAVVAVLLAGHAVHWLVAVPVPTATSEWVWLLVAAWLALAVHLSASLAASLPASAPVTSVSVHRWLRRGATVAAATVPVWAVAMLSGRSGVAGEVSLTYAALAAVAILALAVWLLSRERAS